jgi:sialate O-acetylesterase
LNVPIGLIHSSWGGTIAEAWTSAEALQKLPDFAERLQQVERIRAAGESSLPANQRRNPNVCTVLYNAMIAPLVPFGMKGVIWYQGESNAGRAYQYRTLLPTLIEDWRNRWGEGAFPFLIVQLANFLPVKPEPGEDEWAELREAQLFTAQKVPNCGLAVTIDIGDAADIHPKNKQEVGRRLALAALGIAYKRRIEYSGPIYKSYSREGSSIRIRFTHVDGGLVAHGGALQGFAIAGPDRKFVWAQARIEGDTVVVWSPAVSDPVAVRYGWAINPVVNLYNREGLPASPFRTDDWPGLTVNRK